jgi:hypothetical protein
MGRQDIVAEIEECVLGSRQPPALLLQGPRRMGKSSILKHLPRLLGLTFAPGLLDCQNPAPRESLPRLLEELSKSITSALQRRNVTLSPLTLDALAASPFSAFDGWLNTVERELPPGMRVLLCLDEYESLQCAVKQGWGLELLDYLRSLIQHRPRVVLMFTGAAAFEQQGPEWTSRFINTRRLRVSFLARADALLLLTTPGPALNYEPGVQEKIVDATGAQPYLTQAVAFELVSHLNQHRRTTATDEDAEQAIRRALVSGSEYFANVWNDAREDGQALLLALARQEPLPDLPQARSWLRSQDVLTDAGHFAVPLVERWVREQRLAQPGPAVSPRAPPA